MSSYVFGLIFRVDFFYSLGFKVLYFRLSFVGCFKDILSLGLISKLFLRFIKRSIVNGIIRIRELLLTFVRYMRLSDDNLLILRSCRISRLGLSSILSSIIVVI